jgi:hypothetical protein
MPCRFATAEASSRFGRFKPEKEEPARLPQVSGEGIEQLRRKREMLRAMTPEQAAAAIEIHKELDLFQALALAKKEKKLMVPNDVIDRILNDTDTELSARTGTMVIYQEPGKPFGEKVVYMWGNEKDGTISFIIPENFRGKMNCVLVAEYPDFDVVGSADAYELKIQDVSRLHLLENFPAKREEWYDYDERFGIPVGKPKRESNERRYLNRTESYIGPVVRDFDGIDGYWRRGVGLVGRPSVGCGVALF